MAYFKIVRRGDNRYNAAIPVECIHPNGLGPVSEPRRGGGISILEHRGNERSLKYSVIVDGHRIGELRRALRLTAQRGKLIERPQCGIASASVLENTEQRRLLVLESKARREREELDVT